MTINSETSPPTVLVAPTSRDIQGIDPRGQRFAATLTSLVLVAVVLAIPSAVAGLLLAIQALVFALGAARGPSHQPYASIYRALIKPRVGPPGHLEDPAPPRFAQGVGLGFAVVGLLGLVTGVLAIAYIAVAAALAAALLNASIGLCLGCEVYLLGLRTLPGFRSTSRA